MDTLGYRSEEIIKIIRSIQGYGVDKFEYKDLKVTFAPEWSDFNHFHHVEDPEPEESVNLSGLKNLHKKGKRVKSKKGKVPARAKKVIEESDRHEEDVAEDMFLEAWSGGDLGD